MPSNHLILCRPLLLLLSIFPSIRVFSNSQLFASGGQHTGASGSALPMNIQGWFPVGLPGLISLKSKGFSRVFSNTTIQKRQFFSTLPSLRSNSHIHTSVQFSSVQLLSNLNKMKWQKNTQQVKEQDKCPPKTKGEEIGNLPDKEFWLMIVKWSKILKSKWNHRK